MHGGSESDGGSKYGRIIRTIFVTFAAFGVNFLIIQLLTPVITDGVGTDAYGFVSLAKNVAGYAGYITVALNSHASRFISVEFHNQRLDKANVYFSSIFWGDFVLGSIVMALAVLGIWKLELFFQIPVGVEIDVKLLFLLVFLKFWVTTLFSAFETPAYVADKLDLVGLFKGIANCVEAALLFLLFVHLPPQLYYVGISLLVASLIIVLSNLWISRRYGPQLRISREGFSWKAVRTLVSNGIWSAIVSFGSVLNTGLDLVVCNTMLSPLAMGQLAITSNIKVILGSLYTIVSDAFKPHFLKIYAEGNMEKLKKEMKMSMKFSGWVTNLFFAGFFALGMAYYRLWIPHEDLELLFPLTVVSLAGNLLIGYEMPIVFIYVLTLRQKVSCFFTLASGVLNVAGMYILIRYFHMGIYAVVLTTVVLMAIVHLIAHPLYIAHVMKLPWHTFYPDISRNLLSCGLMMLTFKGVSMLCTPDGWMTLVLCILLVSVLGTGIHLLTVFSREEIRQVKGYVRSLLRPGER